MIYLLRYAVVTKNFSKGDDRVTILSVYRLYRNIWDIFLICKFCTAISDRRATTQIWRIVFLIFSYEKQKRRLIAEMRSKHCDARLVMFGDVITMKRYNIIIVTFQYFLLIKAIILLSFFRSIKLFSKNASLFISIWQLCSKKGLSTPSPDFLNFPNTYMLKKWMSENRIYKNETIQDFKGMCISWIWRVKVFSGGKNKSSLFLSLN